MLQLRRQAVAMLQARAGRSSAAMRVLQQTVRPASTSFATVDVREASGRVVREAAFDGAATSAAFPQLADGWVGDLKLETGRIAPLADGGVTVRTGKTMLLSTAVSSPDPPNKPFFPLTVDAREKFYASGKIPQNFMRREMRQSDAEILRSRLVDRAIRPLFPEGYMQETQIILSLLSSDEDCDLEVLYINAASAALAASDIPWNGPVAAVRVCKCPETGELITHADAATVNSSEFSMLFVGTGSEQEVVMLEVDAAQPITHDEFIKAMQVAQSSLVPILDLQKELAQSVAIEKRPLENPNDKAAVDAVNDAAAKLDGGHEGAYVEGLVREIFSATGLTKHERQDAVAELEDHVSTKLQSSASSGESVDLDSATLQQVCKRHAARSVREAMRALMLDAEDASNVRCDGRAFDELREITSEVGVLHGTHG